MDERDRVDNQARPTGESRTNEEDRDGPVETAEPISQSDGLERSHSQDASLLPLVQRSAQSERVARLMKKAIQFTTSIRFGSLAEMEVFQVIDALGIAAVRC